MFSKSVSSQVLSCKSVIEIECIKGELIEFLYLKHLFVPIDYTNKCLIKTGIDLITNSCHICGEILYLI